MVETVIPRKVAALAATEKSLNDQLRSILNGDPGRLPDAKLRVMKMAADIVEGEIQDFVECVPSPLTQANCPDAASHLRGCTRDLQYSLLDLVVRLSGTRMMLNMLPEQENLDAASLLEQTADTVRRALDAVLTLTQSGVLIGLHTESQTPSVAGAATTPVPSLTSMLESLPHPHLHEGPSEGWLPLPRPAAWLGAHSPGRISGLPPPGPGFRGFGSPGLAFYAPPPPPILRQGPVVPPPSSVGIHPRHPIVSLIDRPSGVQPSVFGNPSSGAQLLSSFGSRSSGVHSELRRSDVLDTSAPSIACPPPKPEGKRNLRQCSVCDKLFFCDAREPLMGSCNRTWFHPGMSFPTVISSDQVS